MQHLSIVPCSHPQEDPGISNQGTTICGRQVGKSSLPLKPNGPFAIFYNVIAITS